MEERFIARKPRDAEEYLDYAGQRVRRRTRKKKRGAAPLGMTVGRDYG